MARILNFPVKPVGFSTLFIAADTPKKFLKICGNKPVKEGVVRVPNILVDKI